MQIVGFILRLLLLLLGLVFFAALLSMALFVLLLWLLRALWAKLTGQPVAPWRFEINRQAAWQRFYPKAAGSAADRTRGAAVVDVEATDITDVEPKKLQER
jgi:hypothetical protein